jgi:hypothetical protein
MTRFALHVDCEALAGRAHWFVEIVSELIQSSIAGGIGIDFAVADSSFVTLTVNVRTSRPEISKVLPLMAASRQYCK